MYACMHEWKHVSAYVLWCDSAAPFAVIQGRNHPQPHTTLKPDATNTDRDRIMPTHKHPHSATLLFYEATARQGAPGYRSHQRGRGTWKPCSTPSSFVSARTDGTASYDTDHRRWQEATIHSQDGQPCERKTRTNAPTNEDEDHERIDHHMTRQSRRPETP